MTWEFDRYVVMMHRRDRPEMIYFSGVHRGDILEHPSEARIFFRKADASRRANDLCATKQWNRETGGWYYVDANVVKMQITMSEIKE